MEKKQRPKVKRMIIKDDTTLNVSVNVDKLRRGLCRRYGYSLDSPFIKISQELLREKAKAYKTRVQRTRSQNIDFNHTYIYDIDTNQYIIYIALSGVYKEVIAYWKRKH